jgi:hypothetical protein
MDHAEPRALRHPERSAPRTGGGHAPWAGLAGHGLRHFGLFSAVARPQLAERALCMWPMLGFWPSGWFN